MPLRLIFAGLKRSWPKSRLGPKNPILSRCSSSFRTLEGGWRNQRCLWILKGSLGAVADRCPSMEILLSVLTTPVAEFVKGSNLPGPGHRSVFSDDLVLEQYDNNTPGNGLPQNPNQRRAGTHSGLITTLRIAKAGDNFYPQDSLLLHYESTYKFNTVPNTPLKKGQVRVGGVLLGFVVNNQFQPIDPNTLAIVGGTEAYKTASGQVTEPSCGEKLLDIQL
jgi:hypothetical protein